MSLPGQTLATEWSLQPLLDWIFSSGHFTSDCHPFVHELAHRLNACGAPVDRLQATLRTLNPEILGFADVRTKSSDITRHIESQYHIRHAER